jgi:hypothetical protein
MQPGEHNSVVIDTLKKSDVVMEIMKGHARQPAAMTSDASY